MTSKIVRPKYFEFVYWSVKLFYQSLSTLPAGVWGWNHQRGERVVKMEEICNKSSDNNKVDLGFIQVIFHIKKFNAKLYVFIS